MPSKTLTTAVTAAILALAGCTGPMGLQNNPVATSTAVGGALGAAAGQATGGDTRSTAVGALAGMSAGMATGALLEGQRPQQPRTCTVFRGGVAVGTTAC